MAEVSALVIQIQATAEGLETTLGGVLQSIQRFAEQTEAGISKLSFSKLEKAIENTGAKVEDLANNTQDKGKKMEAAWDTIGKAADNALKEIVQAVDQGIAAYQSLEFAMMGLQSVAAQSGIGPQAMQAALNKVGDAFLDSASAATAFKNLLTRGFSLDQATNMILRLKESAALGRQANQSLAQSVVAATEGIKNENNALVSNAGVTKNVAKMWQDYAKTRGLAHKPFPLALAA